MNRIPRRHCLVLFTGALAAAAPTTWAKGTQDANATVVRDTLNHAYYGKAVTPADILVRGSVADKQADALRAAVAAAAR